MLDSCCPYVYIRIVNTGGDTASSCSWSVHLASRLVESFRHLHHIPHIKYGPNAGQPVRNDVTSARRTEAKRKL